jgi:hypothetical protein
MANKKSAKGKKPAGRRTRMVLTRRPRLRKDPLAWGLLAGACTAVLILLSAMIRQYLGAVVTPGALLLWVLIAFVISYGTVGCFAFLVIQAASEASKNSVAHSPKQRHPGASAPGKPGISAWDAQVAAEAAAARELGATGPPEDREPDDVPKE